MTDKPNPQEQGISLQAEDARNLATIRATNHVTADLRAQLKEWKQVAEESGAAYTIRNGQVKELRAQIEASLATEKNDCSKALLALSGAGICTPAETYGSNSSWAISDLCRAVTDLRAELAAFDCIIDDEGIARSCINPLEDLKIAVRGLKAELTAKDAEYEEYRKISVEEDAIWKGQVATKDAEIARLNSPLPGLEQFELEHQVVINRETVRNSAEQGIRLHPVVTVEILKSLELAEQRVEALTAEIVVLKAKIAESLGEPQPSPPDGSG